MGAGWRAEAQPRARGTLAHPRRPARDDTAWEDRETVGNMNCCPQSDEPTLPQAGHRGRAVMNAFVTVFYDWSLAVARRFTWAAPLAVRITVGVVFMGTGWTKLHN